MNLPGGWELVLVVLVIMVLFGAKRLPDASRSLGRSIRIFKAETRGLRDDDTPEPTTVHDTGYPPAPITPPSVQPPSVPPGPAADTSQQRQP
ncbi:MAG: Sec-independent protein translocase subunit TatA [Mycobacteriales bacterium]